MPGRAGHVTQINPDGTCRVVNDITGESWAGKFIVMNGGMICFDIVNEDGRRLEAYYPENTEDDDTPEFAPDDGATNFQPKKKPSRGTAVRRP